MTAPLWSQAESSSKETGDDKNFSAYACLCLPKTGRSRWPGTAPRGNAETRQGLQGPGKPELRLKAEKASPSPGCGMQRGRCPGRDPLQRGLLWGCICSLCFRVSAVPQLSSLPVWVSIGWKWFRNLQAIPHSGPGYPISYITGAG